MMDIQLPDTLNDTRERATSSIEALEERMHILMQGAKHDNLLLSNYLNDTDNASAGGIGLTRSEEAENLLLRKYITFVSKVSLDSPSPSGNFSFHNDKPQSQSATQLAAYDGFGPSDCDGIFLSSCGHAVHQGCLDSYLYSLKDR